MFVDKSTVKIKAGDGGDGIVSFRRERYVAYGGPDGGDGGRGGNVVFIASNNQNTLAKFRFQKELTADDGKAGQNSNKHGRNGQNLVVEVPVGTAVIDSKTHQVIADFDQDKKEATIAKGGKGGFGNAHFTSSTRQAPKFAEKGEPGQEFEADLELKMIADVGLVGLPNAGKSTFLASLSNAKPEIADYPFTTLVPNLGVVKIDNENSILVADIPGLIEGASSGKGLGDEFLRHVERTKVLIHLIDAWSPTIAQDYTVIIKELKAYSETIAKKPQLICLTKIDGLDSEIVEDQVNSLKTILPKNTKIFAISSISKSGTKELLYSALEQITKINQQQLADEASQSEVIKLEPDELSWNITKTELGFEVRGIKIERFAKKTDFSSEEGLRRLRDIMRKMGIMQGLEKRGVQPNQTITISKWGSFEY